MSMRPQLHIDETIPGELARHTPADVCRWVHPITGSMHRLDGPAEVMLNGFEAWFVNGRRHRAGGPAYVDDQGVHEWWSDDQRHRIGGPATSSPYTDNEWWVRGSQVEDTADVAYLDGLYAGEETRMLEVLLTLWQPGGPTVLELKDAVAAAHA